MHAKISQKSYGHLRDATRQAHSRLDVTNAGKQKLSTVEEVVSQKVTLPMLTWDASADVGI